MPSPESKRAFQPPEVVEKKRTTRERFATVETPIFGVSLRIEPGVKLDIPRKTIEELYFWAQVHALRYFQILELQKQQTESDKKLKTSAETTEGWRGVQSEPDDFVVSLIPRKITSYEHQLLREATGIAYPTVVHEKLVLTISVPVGFQTKRGPIGQEMVRQVFSEALVGLGLPEDDLKKIMDAKVELIVDEKTLEDLTASGRVSLPPGTKTIDTSWAIKVDRLKKSPES